MFEGGCSGSHKVRFWEAAGEIFYWLMLLDS